MYRNFIQTVGRHALTLAVAAGACGGSAARSLAQCTYGWSRGEPFPGVRGTVYALARSDAPLTSGFYVGGSYSIIGDRFASSIARWNGQRWEALGSGVGGQIARVGCLHEFRGEMIAGGWFSTAGGKPAAAIASWDGSRWAALGGGLSGAASPRVRAMTSFRDELVVTGTFEFAGGHAVSNIARWNGAEWSPLGGGLIPGGASSAEGMAAAVFADELVVAGTFSRAGDVDASALARWDGESWHPFPDPLVSGQVTTLQARGTELLVGGSFSVAGGQIHDMAMWTGSEWAPLGSGEGLWLSGDDPQGVMRAFGEYQGSLVGGGEFQRIDGEYAWGVAGFDGEEWSGFQRGVYGPYVHALAEHNGDLIVGGAFAELAMNGGYAQQRSLARWNGSVWTSFEDDSDFLEPEAAALWNDSLVAAGDFRLGSGEFGRGVIQRTSSGWNRLGGLLSFIYALGSVNGQLFAAGDLRAPDLVTRRIMRWDGAAWTALGDGVDERVYAIIEYNGQLMIGGSFENADGAPARRVARWSGTRWEPVGTSLVLTVRAMAVHEGRLIIGGTGRVYAWQPPGWQTLGSETLNVCQTLHSHNGVLYAGGTFAGRIRAWNGSSWTILDGGMNETYDEVRALSSLGERLVVAGKFRTIGGQAAANIASWSPAEGWEPLNEGVQDGTRGEYVSALVRHGRRLFVLGAFNMAGGLVSSNIASWEPTCPGDADGSHDVGIQDLAIVLAGFGQTTLDCEGGDVDADGDVDLADLAAVLSHFGMACQSDK